MAPSRHLPDYIHLRSPYPPHHRATGKPHGHGHRRAQEHPHPCRAGRRGDHLHLRQFLRQLCGDPARQWHRHSLRPYELPCGKRGRCGDPGSGHRVCGDDRLLYRQSSPLRVPGQRTAGRRAGLLSRAERSICIQLRKYRRGQGGDPLSPLSFQKGPRKP